MRRSAFGTGARRHMAAGTPAGAAAESAGSGPSPGYRLISPLVLPLATVGLALAALRPGIVGTGAMRTAPARWARPPGAELVWTTVEYASAAGTLCADFALEIVADGGAGASLRVEVLRCWHDADGSSRDLGEETGQAVLPAGSFVHDRRLGTASLAPTVVTLVARGHDHDPGTGSPESGPFPAPPRSRSVTLAATFYVAAERRDGQGGQRSPAGTAANTLAGPVTSWAAFAVVGLDGRSFEGTGAIHGHSGDGGPGA